MASFRLWVKSRNAEPVRLVSGIPQAADVTTASALSEGQKKPLGGPGRVLVRAKPSM
jgi:hypothetical protein